VERFTTIHPSPGTLAVHEYPDAAKIVRLSGPKAKRLADLSLHRGDIEFARDCLLRINELAPDPPILREALWRSAIVPFFKCFGDSAARFQLSAQKVLKSEGPVALEVFDYFRKLRDKHLVHDENSYLQGVPGAVLSQPSKPYKVEKIVCFSIAAQTLQQETFANMLLLVETSLRWIDVQFEALCQDLTQELEARSYDDLIALEAVAYKSAEHMAVGETRSAP
jgi:hypothetical protein